MPKSKNRRSVSITAETYDRLTVYCTHKNKKRSPIVEQLLLQFLDREAQFTVPNENQEDG